MSASRWFWAAFVCLLAAGVALALEAKSLSITAGMTLFSAALSVAAVVLGTLAIRRR